MTRIELPLAVSSGNNQNLFEDGLLNDCLFLTGELKIDIATALVQDLMKLEARNRDNNDFRPITLIINCPGGDLYSGWMIVDWMDQMQTPIETFALGQAASAGLMIFMNGTKGLRKATPNTQFMSHRYSIGIEASHADIIAQRNELDRTHDRIINHYIKCTGLPQKVVEDDLLVEHNVWLDAKQCKKYNICDVITNDYFGKKNKKNKNK